MHAVVTSRLDNGNALLNGITEQQLKKLQLVQNSAACVLTKIQKFDHIIPILTNLYWLPVRYRIQYKNSTSNPARIKQYGTILHHGTSYSLYPYA